MKGIIFHRTFWWSVLWFTLSFDTISFPVMFLVGHQNPTSLIAHQIFSTLNFLLSLTCIRMNWAVSWWLSLWEGKRKGKWSEAYCKDPRKWEEKERKWKVSFDPSQFRLMVVSLFFLEPFHTFSLLLRQLLTLWLLFHSLGIWWSLFPLFCLFRVFHDETHCMVHGMKYVCSWLLLFGLQRIWLSPLSHRKNRNEENIFFLGWLCMNMNELFLSPSYYTTVFVNHRNKEGKQTQNGSLCEVCEEWNNTFHS